MALPPSTCVEMGAFYRILGWLELSAAVGYTTAPLAELAKQPHGGMAAGIPALEERRFIGIEPTVSQVAAPSAPCKRAGPEIALHRAQTQPHMLRNSRGGPALAAQGPDLR